MCVRRTDGAPGERDAVYVHDRPGSTVFLAWTHSRSNYFPYDASFNVARDFGRELFLDRPKNVLLVKFNYWLSL